MKNKILYSWSMLFFLLIWIMISCKKSFLEVIPKGKQIAVTTVDYDLLLNNVNFIELIADIQVPMGDEVAAVNPYFMGESLKTQRLFKWEAIIYEPDQGSQEMQALMASIYSYNKIINEVMASTGGTEQMKKSIRAEALAGRAWSYLLLINYYGKPYSEATAATDPGYPIVRNADVTATKFERASVKEVYDFIVEDLNVALEDLPAQTSSRVRMSKPAAEGLLGKVYLFMGKLDKALPLLNAAITDFANAQIPVGLYNYNETLAPDGEFMPVDMFGPQMPNQFYHDENVLAKIFTNNWSFINSELVITEHTIGLFTPSDFRLYFYASSVLFGEDYPNGLLRRIGPPFTSIGVSVPDTYLLLAECKARLGDLSGSVADVETLRKHRMPEDDAEVPSAIAADKFSLVKFILDERIREFAMQGYRWFDMRRLSVDPIYNTLVNYKHLVYDENGNIANTYTLKPERLVLQFPKKIMNENPGMVNNP